MRPGAAAWGPTPPPCATAAADCDTLLLAGPTAVFSNALWLEDVPAGPSTAAVSPQHSPLRQPLKSLTAAAATETAPSCRDDGAHLIAPLSHAASFEHCMPGDVHGTKQLGRGSSSSFSVLFSQLSQQLLALRSGGAGVGDAGSAAAAAGAACQASVPDSAYCELAMESSGGSSAVVPGVLAHASPAHLLAPAPATLWVASPPPEQVQVMAAERSSGGSDAGGQQYGDDPLAALFDLLPAAPAAHGHTPLLMQHSSFGLSSPGSGRYSPPAAAEGCRTPGGVASSGRGAVWERQRQAGEMRSLAHPIRALQPDERQQPSAGLQALVAEHQRPHKAASPLCSTGTQHDAAAPATQTGDSPGLPPARGVDPGHIGHDLDLLFAALPSADGRSGACPGSPLSLLSFGLLDAVPDAPAAAVAGWLDTVLQQEQEVPGRQQRDRQQEMVAVNCMAGHYTPLALQFEALDLRRLTRAVRKDLKRQQAEAGRSALSLLRRLTLGCFSAGAGQGGPQRLNRSLERQRLHLLCLGRLFYSPDEPLHFQLWDAVCWGFTGMGAIEDHPSEALSDVPAWQALGFRAANPAGSLAGAGVLPLLLLLLVLDYAGQLASRLLTAALGSPLGAHQPASLPPFALAEVAVEATTWLLRALAAGELNGEAQRLGSMAIAAELFFLGALDCFLEGWHAADTAAGPLPMDPSRLLLARLVEAEQRARGDVRGTVMRHLRRQC